MRGIEYSVAPAIWAGVFWVLAALALGAAAYLIARLVMDGRRTELEQQAPVGAALAGPTAKTILDERLAKGEIDVDEYRERLEALAT